MQRLGHHIELSRMAATLARKLREAEFADAQALAHLLAAEAWRKGESGVANAATHLAAVLARADQPYLGALWCVLRESARVTSS